MCTFIKHCWPTLHMESRINFNHIRKKYQRMVKEHLVQPLELT